VIFTKKQFIAVLMLLSFLLFPSSAFAAANSTGYAWGENAGWANFDSTYGGATVSATGVVGYIWLENIGWIQLDYDGVAGATNTTSTNWGVTNDGNGNLDGYAWGENVGWINFHTTYSQVTISSGNFAGYAWSENAGWIKMDHAQTSYIPTTIWTANSAPTLTSISATPDPIKGGSQLTITPTGQGDGESDALYYYCNETGTATSANTLCSEANTSYISPYSSMTCTYNVSTGDTTRTVYCRTYDGALYSTEATHTYVVDTTGPTNVGISSITADSSSQLTVTAKTATDSSGLDTAPYQFEETSGNSGASSSDWQASTAFADTGLTPNTQYTYEVRVKDSLGNISDYSSTLSKYTLAAVPGTPTLTVDSATQITASWSANSNPAGTQYYAANTTNSTNSGWITDAAWTSSGLTCNTSYTFTVKAKNGDGTETTTSTSSATTAGCPGGGGLPVGAYIPPSAPLAGFLVQINNGASTTNTQDVILYLRGSSDTIRMSISNDSNFTNAIQESYIITKQWRLTDGQGQKTVYVKFFTAYGVSSNTITATINYQIPSIFTPIIDIIIPPSPPTPPVITPIPPLPPVEQVVPKQAPISMQDTWNILPTQTISNFVLNPIPEEIKALIQKFPQLSKILEEIGFTKITDVNKLVGINLILPNISQIAADKGEIPTEILFAKTEGGLVDYNTTLSFNEQGYPQQQINVIVNKPIQLIIKPDNPAKAIRGYLVFKQNKIRLTSKTNSSDLTVSLLQKEIDINQVKDLTDIEQALVLSVFDFIGPDNTGIWTANITTPVVDGDYEILTVIDYQDQRLQPKELSLVTVVDPEGYVYTKTINGIEGRIPNAKVYLYWLNPETKSYQLWSARDYQQVNPQITDNTGKYSFLVPEGTYYLKVEASGYRTYQGDSFIVKQDNGIHQNIELKSKNWLLRISVWKDIILIILFIVLIFIGVKLLQRKKN